MLEADVIVIGAGAAGCVLAARLSEVPTRRVLLIEAGQDTPPQAEPDDIRDCYPVAYSNKDYFWPGLVASGQLGAKPAPFLQARILGGGSAVMGMWAIRGLPSDYDSWREAGATGWGYDDLLPAFRRLERDLDFEDQTHGSEGPIPIRRHFREVWPGYARALGNAASRIGLSYRLDINSDFEDGVFPVPVTNDQNGRVSAAHGYLTGAVRSRPNLKILTDTFVTRVRFDGRRATGVSLRHNDGGTEEAKAALTVVSAGAIYSPAILLRSGLGPSTELRALGIDPIADLPVGRNLANHSVLNLAMPLTRFARQARSLRTYGLACARLSSEPQSQGDLLLQFIANTSPNAHGDLLGILGTALYAPRSRGVVTLTAPDPDTSPRVTFNLLADPFDATRLAAGILVALRLLDDPEVRATRGPVIAVTPGSFVRRLNRPDTLSRLMATALALVLDGPSTLRDVALRRAGLVVGTGSVSSADPVDLLSYVSPIFHPAGTCAMGRSDDPLAVVDPGCRVRGVDGLAVVDASIIPVLPKANTCIPTMMVAEHAARLLAAESLT